MTEWKLFDEDHMPAFFDTRYLIEQRPNRLGGQPGFNDRARMVAEVVSEIVVAAGMGAGDSIVDLGCGDGELMARIGDQLSGDGLDRPAMWGYDIGGGDLEYGERRGLDVRRADLTVDPIEYGSLSVATEVLEHLQNPRDFLMRISSPVLLVSSPSAETSSWHNDIHAWAWDIDGYHQLIENSGWMVVRWAECDGGLNTFGGVEGKQRFQLAVAVRSFDPDPCCPHHNRHCEPPFDLCCEFCTEFHHIRPERGLNPRHYNGSRCRVPDLGNGGRL